MTDGRNLSSKFTIHFGGLVCFPDLFLAFRHLSTLASFPHSSIPPNLKQFASFWNYRRESCLPLFSESIRPVIVRPFFLIII